MQYLVSLDRVHVMIGMTLKLKQKKITEQMTGIPGMDRVHTFESARGNFLACYSIMFNVVHQFKQRERENALREEERGYLPDQSALQITEYQKYSAAKNERQYSEPNHAVSPMVWRKFFFLK